MQLCNSGSHFPAGCYLGTSLPPNCLSLVLAHGPFHLRAISEPRQIFLTLGILLISHSATSLVSKRENSQFFRAFVIQLHCQILWDNLPILGSVILITFVKSSLPWVAAGSQVPGIRVWAFLKGYYSYCYKQDTLMFTEVESPIIRT